MIHVDLTNETDTRTQWLMELYPFSRGELDILQADLETFHEHMHLNMPLKESRVYQWIQTLREQKVLQGEVDQTISDQDIQALVAPTKKRL